MKGLGANVTVTEIDPVKAVEALMDGFQVKPMSQALKESDFVVTVTGMKGVIKYEDLLTAKPGVVLSNSGHFNNEICFTDLEKRSIKKEKVRDLVTAYRLENGNLVNLIADGRLVNLAAGQGHPVEIMDMSFAIQALTAEYLAKNYDHLENRVYPVPPEIDSEVARIKLRAMNISIDNLSEEQVRYADSWQEGT
jgi:adenosylhomocysteinase